MKKSLTEQDKKVYNYFHPNPTTQMSNYNMYNFSSHEHVQRSGLDEPCDVYVYWCYIV